MHNRSILKPIIKKIDKVVFGLEELEDLDELEEQTAVESKDSEEEEDKVAVKSIN